MTTWQPVTDSKKTKKNHRDHEKNVTLADAIFSIGSMRRLKHQRDEAHQQLYRELTLVR